MVMAAYLIPEETDPQRQLEALNGNGRRYEGPREGLNPLTASREDIEAAGFPPRPDEFEQKELFAAWKDVFTGPLVYERAVFALPFPPGYYNGGSTSAGLGGSHHESSSNWSGAYITPR